MGHLECVSRIAGCLIYSCDRGDCTNFAILDLRGALALCHSEAKKPVSKRREKDAGVFIYRSAKVPNRMASDVIEQSVHMGWNYLEAVKRNIRPQWPILSAAKNEGGLIYFLCMCMAIT